MCLIDLKGNKNFTLQNQLALKGQKLELLSAVPHFSLSPLLLAFLMWGDFYGCSNFACSTIPERR